MNIYVNQLSGHWVPVSSRSELVEKNLAAGCALVETESADRWGHIVFESSQALAIGYRNLGLIPVAKKIEDEIFLGINEWLIGYGKKKDSYFKYLMPTLFHEFVDFRKTYFIARDEIGFVGLTYAGRELWTKGIGVISEYQIANNTISGMTDEGDHFEFEVPKEDHVSSD